MVPKPLGTARARGLLLRALLGIRCDAYLLRRVTPACAELGLSSRAGLDERLITVTRSARAMFQKESGHHRLVSCT